MEPITQARDNYFRLRAAESNLDRFNLPFPIAVFGTLRAKEGNHRRMLTRKPIASARAFLPHFAPVGLKLLHRQGAAGIFEIYFYDPADWPEVITEVDRLESFLPTNPDRIPYYYIRTLAELRIVPDDFCKDLFDMSLHDWYDIDREQRVLYAANQYYLPETEWNFPRVPAWIYSNHEANFACQQANQKDSPILWSHKES
jgi:gamma-glutamylcyclotransferase (GGCT)/AIG2-like uncharacterized protein YtfP